MWSKDTCIRRKHRSGRITYNNEKKGSDRDGLFYLMLDFTSSSPSPRFLPFPSLSFPLSFRFLLYSLGGSQIHDFPPLGSWVLCHMCAPPCLAQFCFRHLLILIWLSPYLIKVWKAQQRLWGCLRWSNGEMTEGAAQQGTKPHLHSITVSPLPQIPTATWFIYWLIDYLFMPGLST